MRIDNENLAFTILRCNQMVIALAIKKFYSRSIILLAPVLNIKQREMPILQLSSAKVDLTGFSGGVTRDGEGRGEGINGRLSPRIFYKLMSMRSPHIRLHRKYPVQ
jgi:hypothetical protein